MPYNFYLILIFVVYNSSEGCILVGLLSSAVDKFKIHLRVAGNLRICIKIWIKHREESWSNAWYLLCRSLSRC